MAPITQLIFRVLFYTYHSFHNILGNNTTLLRRLALHGMKKYKNKQCGKHRQTLLIENRIYTIEYIHIVYTVGIYTIKGTSQLALTPHGNKTNIICTYLSQIAVIFYFFTVYG